MGDCRPDGYSACGNLRLAAGCLTDLGESALFIGIVPEGSETYRVHTSDRRSLAGTSLGAETDESRDEESRLKAGCSQDWLPHKRPINNRPQVANLPHRARGFLGSNLRRRASSFIGRGNLSGRPGATRVSRRQAGRPVVHCIVARKTASRNQRVAMSFQRV
jgi:hypothetical protein